MDDATLTDFAAACSGVQRKLTHWRQRHRRGARIPEGVWREAAKLASMHGINRIARALRRDPTYGPRSSWSSCPAGCPLPGLSV